MIGRREFITLLGGAAGAWPLAARAQQSAMPVIGFLRSTSLADATHLVSAFRQGLKDSGFVEGQNVRIELRSAENRQERLPALVDELIRWPVALIVGDNVAAIAAKSAAVTVPILFGGGGDPVAEGLVVSLNRPGGNVTGVNFFTSEVAAKRLDLLRQLTPGSGTIAVLIHPNTIQTEAERRDLQEAAQTMRQQLAIFDVDSERDIETAFAKLAQEGVTAVLAGAGPFMNSHRVQLVTLAARHALPMSYTTRDAVVAGGLMSYGASLIDSWRQLGTYAARVLRGEKPSDLPVIQPTRFELAINIKTAKSLQLNIPPTLLAIADEVIE
jgi:ABC-type uncharacterized transport system substrate-binding protein